MFTLSKIDRRLLPLYVGSLFQGIIFWYAIEKLFVRSLGISDSELGLILAAMTALIFILEIPSGILSDRWSRKGTLIIGFIALVAGGFVLGGASSIGGVALGFACWGIYDSMISGLYESVIYDTLIDESHDTDDYEKYFGRNEVFGSIGLVIGALGSSVIVSSISYNATFYASIPFSILAIVATIWFVEPTHHKDQQDTHLIDHTKSTFREVVKKPELYWLLASIFATAVVATYILEYGQLWWIGLGISATLFGPISAVLLTSFGLAGILAQYLKSNKRLAVTALISLALSAALIFENAALVVGSQLILIVLVLSLDLILNKRLQDSLSSATRSGASSVVSTLAKLFIIPALIAFGAVSDSSGVFVAGYLALGAAVMMTIAILFTLPGSAVSSTR